MRSLVLSLSLACGNIALLGPFSVSFSQEAYDNTFKFIKQINFISLIYISNNDHLVPSCNDMIFK